MQHSQVGPLRNEPYGGSMGHQRTARKQELMERRGPLASVRVLDFSWIVAGPQATRILADFGAEVIRVEYEARVDSIRLGQPAPGTRPGSLNASGLFNNMNRNKLSITLNVVHPKGSELVKRLISVSDVVIENFRAHVMESWGLGYEEMAKLRPDIIYASISGFGHTGRNKSYITWGPTAQAVSGLTYMSGLPDRPSAGWGYSYMDHTAGYYGAAAILMALHHRERTGEGQYIDLSQVECGSVLTGPAVLDYSVNRRPYRRPGNPPGNHSTHPATAPHNTYPCAGEDRWIAISVFDQEQWSALCQVLGDLSWCRQVRFASASARVDHQEELDQKLSAWTSGQDARDLTHRLQAVGVPAGMVQNARDRVEDDPQLRDRGFYQELDHAELGRKKFEAPPVRLSTTPGSLRHASPLLGEHSHYVLHDILGLPDAEIAELAEEAVF